MDEIRFIPLKRVIEIHAEMIRDYGGEPGLADAGLLDSALAMPQASFGGQFLHSDIFEMAAAYAFHIAMNHAFVDGNKRTAFMTAMLFLKTNGFDVCDKGKTLESAMLAVASGAMGKEEFAGILRALPRYTGE